MSNKLTRTLSYENFLQDEYHYKLNGVKVIAVCPGLLESEQMSKSNRFKSVDHEKAWQMDIQGMIPQK